MGTEQTSAAPPSTARILVADVREALDFYLALGFEVGSVADGWVLLRSGDSRLVLVENARSEPVRPAGQRPRPGSL